MVWIWQTTLSLVAFMGSSKCTCHKSCPYQGSWKCVETVDLHKLWHTDGEDKFKIPGLNHIGKITASSSIFSHILVNMGSPVEFFGIRSNDCQSPYLNSSHPSDPRNRQGDNDGKESSSELMIKNISTSLSTKLAILEMKTITPANVIQALDFHEIPPDISVMRINMDNFNCDIAREILIRGFRPIFFIAQFNPIFPPPIRFNVPFSRAISDAETESMITLELQYSGMLQCSISHLADIVESHDFVPIGIDGYEATFVRSGWARTLYPSMNMDVFRLWAQAYDDKYWFDPFCSWTLELCEMNRLQTWIHLTKTDSFGSLAEQVIDYAAAYGHDNRIQLSDNPLLFTTDFDVADNVNHSKSISPPQLTDQEIMKFVQPKHFNNEDERINNEERRNFMRYQSITCAKCNLRDMDCGCSLGMGSPLFSELGKYLFRMHTFNNNRNNMTKWVVVHISGGVGNQLLQMVTGFMLALVTGRGMAIETRGQKQPLDHSFPYDSVIRFPSFQELNLTFDFEKKTAELVGVKRETVTLFMCSDLAWALEKWDILHLKHAQSPHIFLGNPFHGEFLRQTFYNKPFFFLSHFMWMGNHVRHLKAQFTTWPAPQVWDEAQSLHDFSLLLRSSRPAKVIGVHARINSELPFEYFDHRHLGLVGEEMQEAHCNGHPKSLNELSGCVGHLVEKVGEGFTEENSFPVQSSQGEGFVGIVILWATDNDELTSDLLKSLQSINGVHLVRLVHDATGPDRFNRFVLSGLMDLAMLEESDVLVGTTSSAFSFAAHARGLAVPYYPAFRNDRSDTCGAETGTEGGLLFLGYAAAGCTLPFHSKEVVCHNLEPDCLQFVVGGVFLGDCIQVLATCLNPDLFWANEFLLDLDHLEISSQYLRRNGFVFNTYFQGPEALSLCNSTGTSLVSDIGGSHGSVLKSTPNDNGSMMHSQPNIKSRKAVLEIANRFHSYQHNVCSRCSSKHVYCGCDLGESNPPFRELEAFIKLMQASRSMNFSIPYHWVVVDLSDGIGNQQLQVVTGLMVALISGRGLAINHMNPYAQNYTFAFDSVLDLPSLHDLKTAGVLNAKSSIKFSHKQEHLSHFICGDLKDDFKMWGLMEISFTNPVEPPHVLLGNPFHGEFLRQTFYNKPFFFLSHFMWMGNHVRHLKAQFTTWPAPQVWDGAQSLHDFSLLLRSSRPAKVIGVHARIHTSRPFVYFDHSQLGLVGEEMQEAHCNGHPDSLNELSGCVGHLAEEARFGSLNAGSQEESSKDGAATGVVVLWATDNDQLSSGLLQSFKLLKGVSIVQIKHMVEDKTDSFPYTGLQDIVFLEESDVLVGSSSSTFSFAAHARGLALPYYPSFRNDRSSACGSVTGTEGGLLFFGISLDDCSCDRARSEVLCHKVESECLQFVMGSVFVGQCLQSIAECLGSSIAWAKDFLLDINHKNATENWISRYGFDLKPSLSTYSPCKSSSKIPVKVENTAILSQA